MKMVPFFCEWDQSSLKDPVNPGLLSCLKEIDQKIEVPWPNHLDMGLYQRDVIRWQKLLKNHQSRIFKIEEYNPEWKEFGNNMIADLWSVFRNDSRVVDIQHIGSTSIPGMCAKPYIDIIVGVESVHDVSYLACHLTNAGFAHAASCGFYQRHRPSLPVTNPRMFWSHKHPFTRYPDIDFCIVVVEVGSLFWRSRVEFRDLLKERPDLKNKYSDLKRSIMNKNITFDEYTNYKAKSFMHDVYVGLGFEEKDIVEFCDPLLGIKKHIKYPELTLQGEFKCFSCL